MEVGLANEPVIGFGGRHRSVSSIWPVSKSSRMRDNLVKVAALNLSRLIEMRSNMLRNSVAPERTSHAQKKFGNRLRIFAKETR